MRGGGGGIRGAGGNKPRLKAQGRNKITGAGVFVPDRHYISRTRSREKEEQEKGVACWI